MFMGGVCLLNILIIRDKLSKYDISGLLDWKNCGINEITECENLDKPPFLNYFDLDFIITDTDTLLRNHSYVLNQVIKNNIEHLLVVIGPEKHISKDSRIITNGLKMYEPSINNAPARILNLISNIYEIKKETTNLVTMIYDGSLAKKVSQSLEKGDSRSLQRILDYGNKYTSLNLFLYKEYYAVVMKESFEFAERKGVKHIEKKDLISELMKLLRFDDVKDFATKRITGIIHLAEVNKKNQSRMVAEYIKDYIDENYMKQDTNAGNIAERFGVSATYVGILFKEQEKTTITKYITQLRMARAAELLEDTDMQIQAIAKEVGYSDQNYFARIFKKQTGLSPGEYRSKGSNY